MGRLVFICDTLNFSQFTRRATTEAIAKIHTESVVYCHINIKDFLFKEHSKHSDVIETKYFVRLFPVSILRNRIFAEINFLLNKLFFQFKIEDSDILVILNPNLIFIKNHFVKNRTIFILSDPYHFMGYKYSDESEMIANSNFIFATSKELSIRYIDKYFKKSLNANTIIKYWPNSVDLSIWNLNKIEKKTKKQDEQIVIGFAGNFMLVTDVDLLEGIVSRFSNYKFVLAGKVNLEKGSYEYMKLMKIFELKNVDYKGYIPYEFLVEEVASWDIGIMIDKIDEISSYHHHNKLYQYLALGKPVVYQRNHLDYIEIKDVALCAANLSEFLLNIQTLCDKIRLGHSFELEAINCARSNSSEVRAKDFIDTIF